MIKDPLLPDIASHVAQVNSWLKTWATTIKADLEQPSLDHEALATHYAERIM